MSSMHIKACAWVPCTLKHIKAWFLIKKRNPKVELNISISIFWEKYLMITINLMKL